MESVIAFDGVRVHDGLDVRPLPVGFEVEENLGRWLERSGGSVLRLADRLRIPVDHDHLVGPHIALAQPARSDQEPVGTQPGGQVAVRCGDVRAHVHQLTDADKLVAQRALGHPAAVAVIATSSAGI